MGFWDAVASAEPYANNLHLTAEITTPSLNFYRSDALPDVQPAVSKHWRLRYWQIDMLYGREEAVCVLASLPILSEA